MADATKSLFQGEPQKATSYVTSTTETPKWLQDAIYNQIYQSTNVAETPFTPYNGTLVAGATPQQKQAYDAVSANQGAWKPAFEQAQTGLQTLSGAPGGAAAAQPFIQQAVGTSGVGAAQPYLTQQAAALGGVDTGAGARTLSPYVQQSLGTSGMTAAQPYLQAAGETSAGDIQDFMNPYTQNVTDQIAKLGARNLSENLLPAVSDSFVRAGQFGGTRMGEFGSRALRDTQESVLAQQGQALQTGYGQALSAAQQEAQRQAGLASTAGGLTQAQQQAILAGGQALSSAEQQAAQQEMARAQALGTVGTQLGSLTQQQQQALLSAGSQTGQLTGADLQRQQSVLQQIASQAQQGQQMQTQDVAALEAAGMSQQQLAQRQADSAYQQYLLEQQYPKSQLDWLSTQVRGMAPNVQTSTGTSTQTTGQTYSASPLQQLATGLSASAGLSNLLSGRG
jgi:bacterioferritin (cytochrome b1)